MIAMPLSFIINLIFSTGIFPDALKISEIIPIYKADDPKLVSNYRPISLLPNFEKIIEKCIYVRFMNFISVNNILSTTQFGFRPKLNCEVALLEFTNSIATNLDNNKYSIAAFLDISKAFDCIDFNIIKAKLNRMGFRGIVNDLVFNYLTNRKQYVHINNCNSNLLNTSYGVRQGSILGPLLFLLYINDLPDVLTDCKMIMYADDVVLWYSDCNLNNIGNIMNSEMKLVHNWYNENKLIINLKKSNFMVFHSNKKIMPPDVSPIFLGEHALERVFTVKYLGIYIQHNLLWSYHIKKLITKVAAYVGMISKIRHFFSQKILVMYYYSFIHSSISYGSCVWGNTYQTSLKPIIKLQKRAVRFITFSEFTAHSKPLFQLLGILDFPNLFKFNIILTTFKINNNMFMSSIFQNNKAVHLHCTRQNANSNFFISNINTNYGKFKLTHMGPVLWNALPNDLKALSNYNLFRKKVKNLLLYI